LPQAKDGAIRRGPKSIHANQHDDVDRRRHEPAAIAAPICSAKGRLREALRDAVSH
jgi:hypothetical protein